MVKLIGLNRLWITDEETVNDIRLAAEQRSFSPKASRLQGLSFFRVNFTHDVIDVLGRLDSGVMHNDPYESIMLFGCRGDTDEALRVLGRLTHRLVLDGFPFTPMSAMHLQRILTSHSSTLKHLSITGVRISPELQTSLKSSLAQATCLQSFTLHTQDGVLPGDLKGVSEGIRWNKSLTRIDVHFEDPQGLCVVQLLQAAAHTRKLRKLVLKVQNLGPSIRAAIRNFAEHHTSMGNCKVLLRLHITQLDPMMLIEDPLPTSIRYGIIPLTVSHMDLGALGEALHTNPSIDRLDLALGGISDPQVNRLCQWLGKDTGLKRLNLLGNDIGDESLATLDRVMQTQNRTLEVLELPTDCPRSQRIQHQVDLNKAGRDRLGFGDLPSGMWSHIIDRVNRTHFAIHSLPSRTEAENHRRRLNVVYDLLHTAIGVLPTT